jgi:hypothetical protein
MEEDDISDYSDVVKKTPSKTPSWVMLGFVIGVLSVLAFNEGKKQIEKSKPQAVEAKPIVEKTIVMAPRMTVIEAVFDQWSDNAVWDKNKTEVALWNSELRSFSDCFEVIRTPDGYYFKSIPHLTRPLLTHGVKAGSPLQFTETEDQRASWLREKTEEDWSVIKSTIHSTLNSSVKP